MGYYNHWTKAIQNQQKAQPKPSGKPQQQQGKQRDGFDDEWLGKDVEGRVVEGANVVVLRGRVIDVSRYWLKMVVDGQTLYVNKAFILSIKPAEVKDTASGGGNGGERASRSK